MLQIFLFHLALQVARASTLILPSQDPFYTTPCNVSDYKPGQIIHARNARHPIPSPGNFTIKFKSAKQYLYRTTDSLGQPVAAVTTLLLPSQTNTDKLLSFQLAYDSIGLDCSPSYTLFSGGKDISGTEHAFLAAALDKGWHVVTSDYEGLEAQYTAGTQSGYATLDSLRAVLNAADNDLTPQTNSVLWGYSGGALASEWAAELEPQYAPELAASLKGVALGGLTPNITNVLLAINQGPYVGIAFGGLTGLSRAYPTLKKYINDHLLQNKKASLLALGRLCIDGLLANTTGLDLFSFFLNGKNLLYDTIPKSIFTNAGQMGLHGVPTLPLFIYKAVGDQISPVGDTDDLYQKFCSEGVAIEYEKNVNGDHFLEAILGGPTAFRWVSNQLTNSHGPTHENCSATFVNLTSADIATSEDLSSDIVSYLQSELL